jgi:hypothetical protein
MRQYKGIPYTNVPNPEDKDFKFYLQTVLAEIDSWAKESSAAFGLLENGKTPSGKPFDVAQNNLTKTEEYNLGDASVVQGSTDGGNVQEWYLPSGKRVMVLDSTGKLICDSLKVFEDSTAQMSLDASGSVASFTTVSANGITLTDGSQFAMGTGTSFVSPSVVLTDQGFNNYIPLYDTAGIGATGLLDFQGITNGATFTFPAAGGALLTSSSTVTLATSYTYSMATGAGGFSDGGLRRVRFDLSGLGAASSRVMKWPDISGTPVVVGNTTAASGTLGSSSLTARTASIASTTLLTGTSATAGMYRVSAYMKTTTAGSAGDVVKLTVSWNDGSAQTMDIPWMTTAGAATNLDLATLNADVQGSVVVYADASQNITYTTTVTKTGSPQYSVYVRIEKL